MHDGSSPAGRERSSSLQGMDMASLPPRKRPWQDGPGTGDPRERDSPVADGGTNTHRPLVYHRDMSLKLFQCVYDRPGNSNQGFSRVADVHLSYFVFLPFSRLLPQFPYMLFSVCRSSLWQRWEGWMGSRWTWSRIQKRRTPS